MPLRYVPSPTATGPQYSLPKEILQLDGMTQYAASLEKLYSRDILKDALALIDGEDVFPLKSNWKMHDLLINGYLKVIQNLS